MQDVYEAIRYHVHPKTQLGIRSRHFARTKAAVCVIQKVFRGGNESRRV